MQPITDQTVAQDSPTPPAGAAVPGYRLIKPLGWGGMGTVWQAEQLALHREVALKVLHPMLSDDEGFRARFRQESRVLASIDHPNIVAIYEAGETPDGVLWLSMKKLDAVDLGAWVDQRGPLPVADAVSVLRQVAQALAAAHEVGVVHRDIKPANILVEDSAGDLRVHLVDFGIAKHNADPEAAALTRTAEVIGTFTYMAPERFAGASVADPKTDIYSVGCLGYWMLVGRDPFDGETHGALAAAHMHIPAPRVRRMRRDVPARLDESLRRAMAKEPRARPTARGLDEQIARVQSALQGDVAATGTAPTTEPTQVLIPHSEQSITKRTLLYLAYLSCLFIVAVVIGWQVL